MTARSKRLTLADVAKQAGVSPATVSLALNNSPLVRSATRDRILELAQRMGYTRHPAARRLATNRSDCLCVVFATDASDPFYWDILQGIMETAEQHAYRLTTSTRTARAVVNSLDLPNIDPSDIDGILVLNWHDRYVVRYVMDLGLPCVLVDASGDHPDAHAVDNDDYGGTRLGVGYLIGLGHRRIGLVGTPMDAPFGRQTWQAYVDAMAAANLYIEPWLTVNGDFSIASGIAAADILLSRTPPPTAIFAVNDEMALGVMHAARRRGLRVPEDLSVAGMDNLPMGLIADPPLTTVKVDRHGLGQRATEMLIDLVAGTYAGPVKVTLGTELIERQSCRKISSALPDAQAELNEPVGTDQAYRLSSPR
jgi:DNA-binding LacI/PurR family transcriptional regulator